MRVWNGEKSLTRISQSSFSSINARSPTTKTTKNTWSSKTDVCRNWQGRNCIPTKLIQQIRSISATSLLRLKNKSFPSSSFSSARFPFALKLTEFSVLVAFQQPVQKDILPCFEYRICNCTSIIRKINLYIYSNTGERHKIKYSYFI